VATVYQTGESCQLSQPVAPVVDARTKRIFVCAYHRASWFELWVSCLPHALCMPLMMVLMTVMTILGRAGPDHLLHVKAGRGSAAAKHPSPDQP
jgi:hypothetical protein